MAVGRQPSTSPRGVCRRTIDNSIAPIPEFSDAVRQGCENRPLVEEGKEDDDAVRALDAFSERQGLAQTRNPHVPLPHSGERLGEGESKCVTPSPSLSP
jgi:hypothetical protein